MKSCNLASIGLLILRVGIAGFMASHGWGKVQMLFSGDISQFPALIGLSPKVGLALAAGAEFCCSLLVVVGFLTRLAAVPVVFTMCIAVFVVHAADPLSSETAAKAFFAGTSKVWFSKEPAITYLVPFLALIFTGAGKFSVDYLVWSKRRPQITTENN